MVVVALPWNACGGGDVPCRLGRDGGDGGGVLCRQGRHGGGGDGDGGVLCWGRRDRHGACACVYAYV